jgi:hypothetical protein
MECTDRYEGLIQALPGLCTWDNRARTRATRSLKKSPCRLGKMSDMRTAPQYECLCDGRANIVHIRRREEVLDMPLWGKCTKSLILTYHRYVHNPRSSRFRPQCSSNNNLLAKVQNILKQASLDGPFECASNAPTIGFKHPQNMNHNVLCFL